MLQYEVKAATRASLVAGWLLTIGGIIGVVLPDLPGLPFLLLGLSTLSKRYGWARRVTTWLNLLFVDQATPRSRKRDGGLFMLQLETQHSDDVTTIWCKGRIVLGGDLHRLKVATLSQNTPEVMLDLSSVNLIDAAGLGALVDLHKRFKCAGKEMELMDPTRFVSHVFRITRLDEVFHIVRTRQIAVARTNRRKRRSGFVQLFMTTLAVAAGVVVSSAGF
jgi:anti-anti-sigma factor